MLFVDSTVPEEVRAIFAWGVAGGVTTNPLIFARESGALDLQQRIKEILAVSSGPLSVELTETDEAAMRAEAERYHSWDADRICIKVPFSEIGLRVTRALSKAGVSVNVTCIMSFSQAYLATLAGARYVSVFAGRVRDTGYEVWPTIRRTRAQLDREDFRCEIIVGSIRHRMDVDAALDAGAHIVTVPPPILRKMPHHPKTDEAIQQFNDAWAQRADAASDKAARD